jgi:hypothetical protein
MRRVEIVPKNKALLLLPRIIGPNSLCYYLVDDYPHFIDLRDKLVARIEIKNLSELFHTNFVEIKRPFLELIDKLNKKYGSFTWWGSQLASRSSLATPLLFNITCLFCAKELILDSQKDIIFIVDSHALSSCISKVAKNYGYRVVDHGGIIAEYFGVIKRYFRYGAQVIYFFSRVLQNYAAAIKLLKPLPAKKIDSKKRIVVRSWVTEGSFDKFEEFKDRNFGILPRWLSSHDYEIWILPMLFYTTSKIKEIYALMGKQKNQQFLIPEHYLKFSDYLVLLFGAYKLFRMRLENVKIMDVDVSPLFNEVLMRGFYPYLLLLNLSSPMLKRLKENGFEIDGFYYPFECNAPEKQFILSCRKYFPEARIFGFQHTVFFPNQLAYHFLPGETNYHPLPDKIICSGPVYVNLYKNAGFSENLFAEGANLRYDAIYATMTLCKKSNYKSLLLPLPGLADHKLAFEFMARMKNVADSLEGYRFLIRSHPVLSTDKLVAFAKKIGLINYEFANEGVIQDYFPKVCALVSIGTSVTVLEAAVAGLPVIQLIPESNIFFNPFVWPGYPLEPINSARDVRKQLELIDKINNNDENTFSRIGREVLTQYFAKPTDDNLKVFLL